MNVTSSYRWTILGVITFCLLAFGIVFQSIPPILGTLIDTFHISHTQAGALMGLFLLPAIFLALPGGVLASVFRLALGRLARSQSGFAYLNYGRRGPISRGHNSVQLRPRSGHGRFAVR